MTLGSVRSHPIINVLIGTCMLVILTCGLVSISSNIDFSIIKAPLITGIMYKKNELYNNVEDMSGA